MRYSSGPADCAGERGAVIEIPTEPYGLNDLVSADDHIIEPPGVWTERAPASLAERAPAIVVDEGLEKWRVEDRLRANHGLSVMAGRSYEDFTSQSQSFKDMRPGCYDPVERVRDMDLDGVLTQMCFPSLAGIGGEAFMALKDPELRDWVFSAYNDWLLEEFQATAPGRLVGHAILPLYDPAKALAEFERIASKGVKSLSVPGRPQLVEGCLALIHPDLDPLWSSVEEHGAPINIHLGQTRTGGATSQMLLDPLPGQAEAYIAAAPLSCFEFLGEIIWGGLLERHPTLKVVSSEGGIGWLPYFLERSDYTFTKHRFWTKSRLDKKPSFYFHRQCYAAFIHDEAGVFARELIGVDSILWESDYPHTDTTWPRSHEWAAASLKGVPEDEYRKITRENAEAVYNLG